jgi:hypothetical protein
MASLYMIILLGLPKSGTTSFDHLFNTLGYKTYHWMKKDMYIGTIVKNNKLQGKPLLSGFEPDCCITQMDVCVSKEDCYWPQVVDYKRIYEENPDALYILNMRDPHKILLSFSNWNSYQQRLFRLNPELVKTKDDEGFLKFVEDHYANIETFFRDRPEARFISYDIENDRIDKLAKYIDIGDVVQFPHKNISKSTARID